MVELLPESSDALAVLRRLRAAGYEAYFAGGCVRDLLMGRAPKDYDVATSAGPNQVRQLFKNSQAVGAAFGVILVRSESSSIEVATFRTDLDYQDGRRPTGVKFATAQEDALRRDFTINGLFLDPIDGRIIDHVGGQADVAAGRLRAIGDPEKRFAEDHLRLLRALRFASRLNFAIEPATAGAIQTHAHELIRISPERIAQELRKMLMPITRINAYRLLGQFGFIPILMRFLPRAAENPPAEPAGLFDFLPVDREISFGLALAAMVLDFRLERSQQVLRSLLAGREISRAVTAMRQTFKISNDESSEMLGSMSFLHLLGDTSPTVAALKRFLNQPHAGDAERLMTAIAGCGILSGKIDELRKLLDHWRSTEFAPPPLITGDDLTTAGAAPGPKFKIALDAAYDAQLEGTIETKEQAMELAKKTIEAK